MVQLLKVHGSQNQFFILDQTQLKNKLSDQERIALAKHITDKDAGLLHGADGLLVIDDSDHDGTLGSMEVINTDGSIASMCGNGLRTVSRYLAEKYGKDEFKVQTQDSDLAVHKEADLANGVPTFSVEISPVSFNKESLPFDNLGADQIINQPIPEFGVGVRFTAIAVPNPHLIGFGNFKTMKPDGLKVLGSMLNNKNKFFPDGVNVSFAEIQGPNTLFVQTFERGVGLTNACGTGMSAASLAFCINRPELAKFDELITVYNPGGMVKTRVHDDNDQYTIDLIGNATFTHKVEISEDALHSNDLDDATVTETGEQAAYETFVGGLDNGRF
ncbi:diaminopimelate epimerase [Lentilactobacillus kisonensis]|uniref:Diaminopimelate epimerase n=2 Tax=Lentilactobacillus kisonensis TaxID=481722 RepID=H1LKD3_9LACO|nr:diaminopimelate epimerase [Lentilactobacillus kisonensis]EHO47519.1 diaminopimelate epimerase [Lentilactobacillus kisonensis F0435]KRL20530.1 diaminopimelate epimerase [Lentilactobacillus kisonensis DSM 19906 = JCM 15041]